MQEFKGYIFKIMGGQDKQGFPMKQGAAFLICCACVCWPVTQRAWCACISQHRTGAVAGIRADKSSCHCRRRIVRSGIGSRGSCLLAGVGVKACGVDSALCLLTTH